jgi:hypothetical protein
MPQPQPQNTNKPVLNLSLPQKISTNPLVGSKWSNDDH